MEKIYMEDYMKNNKKRKINFSIVLSFVVSIFAITSLAIYGIVTNQKMNTVTYALPDANDTFTLYMGKLNSEQLFAYIPRSGENPVLSIPMHCKDASCATFVYCYKRELEAKDGISYTFNSNLTEAQKGLVYLINRFSKENAFENKYADHWAKQVAVWLYLGSITNEEIEYLTNNTNITLRITNNVAADTVDLSVGNVYNTIKTWVDDAKRFEDLFLPKYDTTPLEVQVVQAADKKYYQTSAIPVESFGNSLLSYNVTFEGIDGVIAVDENGNVATGALTGSKFYARIPTDKVTKEAQQLKITISGNFNLKDCYVYSTEEKDSNNNSLQPIVLMGDDNVSYSRNFSIKFTGVPDTSMNIAQTIYFVGLIVLLCGVGIIYANAKPIEKEQQ